jgi:hypothetical protein
MTVVNIIGSNLEDVWGPDVTSSSKKKKKSRKDREATCNTYTRSPAYYDDIMDVYWPTEEEPYNKSKYSRTQHPLSDTDAEERETEVHNVKVQQNFEKEHFTELKDYIERNKDKFGSLFDDKEKQYLDMAMYVFSGIALIFILEQFVSIGMVLGSR